jgi:hypothetical protein
VTVPDIVADDSELNSAERAFLQAVWACGASKPNIFQVRAAHRKIFGPAITARQVLSKPSPRAFARSAVLD